MPPGDVMKTPLLKDLSALRLCNPPALRLLLWPAIDRRSQLSFQCNLMSIPIEPARPPFFLFVVYSGLLDGQTALVVLNILFKTGHILGGGGY